MARRGFALTLVVILMVCMGGEGCGSSKPPEPPLSFGQLRDIGRAYLLATDNLERPPVGKEDLLPILKELRKDDNPADVFRSNVDNEEFVIHWGLDLRDVTGAPNKMPVLVYEKTGRDGKRMVLQGYRYTRLVPDDQMGELVFPPGFRNPFK